MTIDEAIKELKEMRTDPWTDSRQMKAIELARLTGLTRASLSAYEKGIQMPTGNNILKIAEVLGVEPKDLVVG